VERMNLYRQISEAQDVPVLGEVRTELSDRFGAIPQEVENLLAAAELKIVAGAVRLPRITYKNQRLFLEMPGQEDAPYFYEKIFHPLLERVTGLSRRYVLRESKSKKLRAIIQDVQTLEAARQVIESLVAAEIAEPAG